MKRLNRISGDAPTTPLDAVNYDVSRGSELKYVLNPMMFMGILVVCLMGLSVIFSISVILRDPSPGSIWAGAEARVISEKPQEVTGLEDDAAAHRIKMPENHLLCGLLSRSFDEKSCLSRYQSVLYHKGLSHKPSSYLVSRLRNYEILHRRCGPYTESYNKTVKQLKLGQHSDSDSDCKYLVWIPFSGLGNRILTQASAFLYAMLTNRVLLVDHGTDMLDLFCEPFPNVSWLLPNDFPITNQFSGFDQKSPHCYGNLMRKNASDNLMGFALPPSVYLHLVHDYDDQDKLFFCDQDQTLLQKVSWLIMKSDFYFIPSLFLIPSFEQELNNLFPVKETVFHFLGRYLFHPTNSVWGLITRYYQAYLAKADEKLGIQIRIMDAENTPFQSVLDQILACTMKENLLPEINQNGTTITEDSSTKQKTKAVLMTSLNSGYFEKVKDMYWEHPTMTGEVIGVFQPSHEKYQQTEKPMHNQKAWAEMYLLSLTDKLVTSAWSTFGYVAQGIGGLKPWILYKFENQTAPNPPCRRAMSMEPCFHAPPFYDCKKKTGIDTGLLLPHVRHCEDMSWGLKLVGHETEL